MKRSERSERSLSERGPSPRLLNLHEAAAYLSISFWSVRDYVLAGLIPVVQLPALRPREGERPRQALRRVLVDVQDLDAFIAAHKTDARDCPSGAPSNSAEMQIREVCPQRARPEAVQKPEPRS